MDIESEIFSALYTKDIKLIKKTLDEGIDPNTKNKDGTSILNMAIRFQNVKIVKMMLEYGADPDEFDNIDKSPLIEAIKFQNVEIIEMLLEYGANPNKFDNIDKSPLMTAILYQNIDIVKLLLEYEAKPNNLSLMTSIRFKNFDLVKLLLEFGVDPNSFDNINKEMDTPLIEAIMTKVLELVKILLDHKADPNLIGYLENPLEMAKEIKSDDIYQLLIEYGADINLVSDLIREGINILGYNIIKSLGKGTYGTVYLAEKNKSEYAIKVIPEKSFESGIIPRLDDNIELIAMKRIKGYDNLVQLYDAKIIQQDDKEYLYIIMEYVPNTISLGQFKTMI